MCCSGACPLHQVGTDQPSLLDMRTFTLDITCTTLFGVELTCIGMIAGGVQPGDGQLQLGAGLGMLQCHAARRCAAQHPLLQCGASTSIRISHHADPRCSVHLAVQPRRSVWCRILTAVPWCVCVQLIAACERDGEADRALEAFARMEREAGSKCLHSVPSLPKQPL